MQIMQQISQSNFVIEQSRTATTLSALIPRASVNGTRKLWCSSPAGRRTIIAAHRARLRVRRMLIRILITRMEIFVDARRCSICNTRVRAAESCRIVHICEAVAGARRAETGAVGGAICVGKHNHRA